MCACACACVCMRVYGGVGRTGRELVPPTQALEGPSGEALGPAIPQAACELLVEGDSWRRSSQDVCIAGVGWVAVGVNGACRLRVWAPKVCLVTKAESLLIDYADRFERPGFGGQLPKSK